MNALIKKALPHLIAIGVFILAASLYFAPVWNGMQLKQDDVEKYQGAAKEITDYRSLNGEEPLWTNSMFGGMPSYQISTEHSGNWIAKVGSLLRLGLPAPVGILFVSFLGFYILGLCLRVNPYIALVGALASGFASFNFLYIGAGHITKVISVSYMAPTLGGLLLATRGKAWLGSVVFSLFLALNISANHLQITYYLFLMLGVIALGEGIRLIWEKKTKDLLITAGALVLGTLLAVLPSTGNLMTTYEYAKYSTRGESEISVLPKGQKQDKKAKTGLDKDYILEYNFGPGEFLSLLIPNAKGGANGYIGNDDKAMESLEDETFANQIAQSSHYWGGQGFSGGAIYVGAVAVFLFLIGLFLVNDTLRFPLLMLSFLCILLSSKTGSINLWFIDHFPLYNKFRDTKMILVMMQVLIPLMGVLLLDKLWRKEPLIGTFKYQSIVLGGAVLLGIILYVAPDLSGNFITQDEVKMLAESQNKGAAAEQIAQYRNELIQVRKGIYQADAGRTLWFFILAGAVIFLIISDKLNRWICLGALGVFIAYDQFTVDKRYLSDTDAVGREKFVDKEEQQIAFTPDLADLSILEKESSSANGFAQTKAKMLALYEKEQQYPQELRTPLAGFAAIQLNSDYRVLTFDNPIAETRTSFFHKSIGGYHGAKMKRYQQLVDFYLSNEISEVQNALITSAVNSDTSGALIKQANELKDDTQRSQFFSQLLASRDFNKTKLTAKTPILNMLNTRYFITSSNQPAFSNAEALGNAWFVNEVKCVNSANDEITGLGTLNTKTQAILNQKTSNIKPAKSYQTDSNDVVKLKRYATKKLVYESQSDKPGFAVFSEIYYPEGWKCFIDNKEVPYTRVNFVLRGLEIPQGKHTIEWRFEPPSYLTGNNLSMFGSIALLLAFFGVFGYEWKKSQGHIQDEA